MRSSKFNSLMRMVPTAVIFAAVSLTATVSAESGGGSKGGGGGDPTLTRRADIKLFLVNETKGKVKATIEYILGNLVESEDRKFKAYLNYLVVDNLQKTVADAVYDFDQPKCEVELRDQNGEVVLKNGKPVVVERGGSADVYESNDPKRPSVQTVCWSPAFLEAKGTQPSELVSLAFHEAIHHHGEWDHDHVLAAQFKKYYLKMIEKASTPPPAQTPKPVDPLTRQFQNLKVWSDYRGEGVMVRVKQNGSNGIDVMRCDLKRYYEDGTRYCRYSLKVTAFWDPQLQQFCANQDGLACASGIRIDTDSLREEIDPLKIHRWSKSRYDAWTGRVYTLPLVY